MATYTPFLRAVNTRLQEQPLNVKFRHGKIELVIPVGAQILPKHFKNGRVTGTDATLLNAKVNNIISDLTSAYEAIASPARWALTRGHAQGIRASESHSVGAEAKSKFDNVFNHLHKMNAIDKYLSLAAEDQRHILVPWMIVHTVIDCYASEPLSQEKEDPTTVNIQKRGQQRPPCRSYP